MYLTEEEVIQAYDAMLDEGPVRIGALEYSASEVLRKIDPIAYRTGLLGFVDQLASMGELPDGWEEWTFEEV